jgi:hypothetical protein
MGLVLMVSKQNDIDRMVRVKEFGQEKLISSTY